jgi:hypothetical protein
MTQHNAEYHREWRKNNPGSVVAARARYRSKLEKRELERAGSLAYYRAHKPDFIKRQRAARAANPEQYRMYSRRNYKTRLTKPAYRVAASMRASLHKALRGEKRARTFAMLGYSRDDLMTCLERQFTKGISWKNYGAWHIDHKRPSSSFDLPRQLIECWALPNLQPLWAFDNLSKKDRWEKC